MTSKRAHKTRVTMDGVTQRLLDDSDGSSYDDAPTSGADYFTGNEAVLEPKDAMVSDQVTMIKNYLLMTQIV